MEYPKISIVTPSFNQGKYIEQTILSILDQKYPNLEYIIIDGGSTDNSIEIIKKYESQIAFWVSEKDMGQAHAINKGLSHCTGQFFNWINSDDYLDEGALFTVAKNFTDERTGIVAGAVCNFDEKGFEKIVQNRRISIEGILSDDTDYIYHQPGVWMRMNIMEKVGKFGIDYHYCFDQEYILRYLLLNDQVKYITETLAHFRLHEVSKTVSQAASFYWDFSKMYREFWKKNKHSAYAAIAREKHKKYEWPLLQQWVGEKYKSRGAAFFVSLALILKDPLCRFNKSNLGWLKHILIGSRN